MAQELDKVLVLKLRNQRNLPFQLFQIFSRKFFYGYFFLVLQYSLLVNS